MSMASATACLAGTIATFAAFLVGVPAGTAGAAPTAEQLVPKQIRTLRGRVRGVQSAARGERRQMIALRERVAKLEGRAKAPSFFVAVLSGGAVALIAQLLKWTFDWWKERRDRRRRGEALLGVFRADLDALENVSEVNCALAAGELEEESPNPKPLALLTFPSFAPLYDDPPAETLDDLEGFLKSITQLSARIDHANALGRMRENYLLRVPTEFSDELREIDAALVDALEPIQKTVRKVEEELPSS
jgi:hypothetical protein